MGSEISQIEEQRSVGRMSVDEADGRVGDGFCIIVTIRETVDWCQIAVHKLRTEIAATAGQRSVVSVETSLRRIRAVRRAERALDSHMPLPGHIRAIAGIAEQFSQGRDFPVDLTAIARTVLVDCSHPSHARIMRIAARQERGATRTTAARVLELAETQSGVGQAVEMRRLHLAPVAPNV